MKNEEIVIIVPGSKYIKSRPGIEQYFLLWFYKTVRIFKPISANYAKDWRKRVNSKNREVLWLHWGRGITFISKWFAVRKLRRLLRHHRSHKIKLIGISLGGAISLEAVEKEKNNSVNKIILVCSTNEDKTPDFDTKIINIYSEKDLFARLATKVLAPVHGGQKLHGKHVVNVQIPDMTHDEFCADSRIKKGKYKGKSITQLINYFLK